MYYKVDIILIFSTFLLFLSGELDANRPVPFRLTPNLWEFITPVGVHGVVAHSMIAVARCLVQPQFSINSYFKTILKDEIIGWNKKVCFCVFHMSNVVLQIRNPLFLKNKPLII